MNKSKQLKQSPAQVEKKKNQQEADRTLDSIDFSKPIIPNIKPTHLQIPLDVGYKTNRSKDSEAYKEIYVSDIDDESDYIPDGTVRANEVEAVKNGFSDV